MGKYTKRYLGFHHRVQLRKPSVADTARFLGGMDFGRVRYWRGNRKKRLGEIVKWTTEELPANKPKHMLVMALAEPMSEAVAMGVDNIDRVSPTRVGRNRGTQLTQNIKGTAYKTDFNPLMEGLWNTMLCKTTIVRLHPSFTTC